MMVRNDNNLFREKLEIEHVLQLVLVSKARRKEMLKASTILTSYSSNVIKFKLKKTKRMNN